MGTAIVAIPSKDDYVWNVSSEKVPHLTVLYLGETTEEQNEQIAKFLEHVANVSLGRFGLSVDKRGELGDDKADVLFFKKDRWSFERIRGARANLLKDPTILAAYNSTEQFPEWIPHLTLGFPGTPAKKDTREYPSFHYVDFDKIGLWTGDFVGYEFDLEDSDDIGPVSDVEWSDITNAVEGALAHFGVKGMRWGVRKDRSGSSGPTPVVAKTKPGTSKVQTEGGKGHPASDDVLQVASAKQKLQASGMNSLSNAELKVITDRMNMEQNFAKAIAALPPKHPGREMVKKMVKDQGKTELNALIKGDAGKWTKRVGALLTVTAAAHKAPRGAATVGAGVVAVKGAFKNTGGKHRKL